MEEITQSTLTWILNNKEWLFSGVGVAIVLMLVRLISKKDRPVSKVNQKAGDESVQVGGNLHVQTTGPVNIASTPPKKRARLRLCGFLMRKPLPFPKLEKPTRDRISLHKIRMSGNLKDCWVPLDIGEKTCGEGLMRYTFTIENRGEVTDSNILVYIRFDVIKWKDIGFKDLKLPESGRVQLLEGGLENSGFVKLLAHELVPGERLSWSFLTNHSDYPLFEARGDLAGDADEFGLMEIVLKERIRFVKSK